MKRTKKEADITRQQLLESALRVFSEKGYAATRLSDIALAANVTRGAIYHHFGNKKALFIALFKDRVDPYFQVISEILSSNLSPLDKIRDLMVTVIKKLEEDDLFQADERLRMRKNGPLGELDEFKDILFDDVKRSLTMAEKVVKAGQEEGEIRPDISAKDIVIYLFAFLRGIACILEAEPLTESIIGKEDTITELFLSGIQKR